MGSVSHTQISSAPERRGERTLAGVLAESEGTPVRKPAYDLLLQYMSLIAGGTWSTFRLAIDQVAAEDQQGEHPRWVASTVAANLSSLAHAEFAFDDTLAWEISPATIVTSSMLGSIRAFLCGVRTHDLLQGLEAACFSSRAHLTLIRQDEAFAPAVIEIGDANEAALAVIASQAGVHLEVQLADRLLKCLPDLASLFRAAPVAALPLGFPIKRFDPARLLWLPTQSIEGDGAYLFEAFRPEYRVVSRGTIRKVSRSMAVYHALARMGRIQTTISYNDSSQGLTIPVAADLPLLHRRAMVLYSGRVPTYVRGSLRFDSVPPHAAAALMHVLEWSEEVAHG